MISGVIDVCTEEDQRDMAKLKFFFDVEIRSDSTPAASSTFCLSSWQSRFMASALNSFNSEYAVVIRSNFLSPMRMCVEMQLN